MAKTLIEFNEEFYAKLLRLLLNPSKEAGDELRRMHDLSVKQYELNGWIDEETLKKLHAPREKQPTPLSRLPSSSPAASPRRTASDGGEKEVKKEREKDKPVATPDHSIKPSKPKVKLEAAASASGSGAESQTESITSVGSKKQKVVKQAGFRDDPSIFGPLDAMPTTVMGAKRKAISLDGNSPARKVKKKNPSKLASSPAVKPEPKSSSDSDHAPPAQQRAAKHRDRGDVSPSVATADDVASELGCACAICSLVRIQPDNALVECQDCRQVYHQKCHDPPVSESEFNDPRHVWYCSACSSKIHKPTSFKASARFLADVSSSDEGSNTSKPEKAKPKIASLAADFLAKHKSKVGGQKLKASPTASKTSSTKTPLGSGSSGTGINALSSERLQELAQERLASGAGKKSKTALMDKTVSHKDKMVAADRRLHLMKKKAEGKQMDRKLFK